MHPPSTVILGMIVGEVEGRGLDGEREGACRVNWASLVFGTLQSVVEEEGAIREWILGESAETRRREAKGNGPSRSCKDIQHYFMNSENVESSGSKSWKRSNKIAWKRITRESAVFLSTQVSNGDNSGSRIQNMKFRCHVTFHWNVKIKKRDLDWIIPSQRASLITVKIMFLTRLNHWGIISWVIAGN